MPLKANEFYDCYAESAELYEGKPDAQNRTSLSLKVSYRFPESGTVMTHYHCLIKKDGTVNVDKSGVSEISKLENRYGFDLSSFEVDNTKLSQDIVVRAKIIEEVWNGRTQLKIDRIFDKLREESAPVDKSSLQRRFGALLRASKAATRTPTVSAPNAGPPKGAAKPATPTPTPAAPTAPKAPQGAPQAPISATPSTMEECWGLFAQLPQFKSADEGTLGEAWWGFLNETFGHQQQERLTPQEWGKAKARIESMEEVPF